MDAHKQAINVAMLLPGDALPTHYWGRGARGWARLQGPRRGL